MNVGIGSVVSIVFCLHVAIVKFFILILNGVSASFQKVFIDDLAIPFNPGGIHNGVIFSICNFKHNLFAAARLHVPLNLVKDVPEKVLVGWVGFRGVGRCS